MPEGVLNVLDSSTSSSDLQISPFLQDHSAHLTVCTTRSANGPCWKMIPINTCLTMVVVQNCLCPLMDEIHVYYSIGVRT